MKGEIISTKKMLKELNAEVKELGGPAAAGRKWGISAQVISSAIKASKLPGPTILRAMGLKHVKQIQYNYERIK